MTRWHGWRDWPPTRARNRKNCYQSRRTVLRLHRNGSKMPPPGSLPPTITSRVERPLQSNRQLSLKNRFLLNNPLPLEQVVGIKAASHLGATGCLHGNSFAGRTAQPETEKPESTQLPVEEDITVTTWLSSPGHEELKPKLPPKRSRWTGCKYPRKNYRIGSGTWKRPAAPEPPRRKLNRKAICPIGCVNRWNLRWRKKRSKRRAGAGVATRPGTEPEEPMPAWMEEPEKPTTETVPTGPEEWIPMEDPLSIRRQNPSCRNCRTHPGGGASNPLGSRPG